ncbi:hypothetical protein DPMN_009223 [Dreissena polymorpha]|uniref:Uncharacterized protein n=1 Tax=Dreissena polymorpha TaxID=45954 RepID=A0A9D4MXN6_DREPO|nr:hypothetical protein DPMN_009201 [Dreissena polymorpha]KAH3885230.1 hypothetical protein DPMN_009223 [Dreissena polymorpha]
MGEYLGDPLDLRGADMDLLRERPYEPPLYPPPPEPPPPPPLPVSSLTRTYDVSP